MRPHVRPSRTNGVAYLVEWGKTHRDEFNSLVELLIVRKYDREGSGLVAQAIDGRGGDGGIDIDVRVRKTGQLVKIYQLKHFAEGFSGEWAKSRKPQIQRSLEEALKLSPPSWTLVIPRNFTVNERKWVTITAAARTRVGFMGETELNSMLADDPDAHRWADHNALREALSIVRRDSGALNDPRALADEVRRLADRADARSSYWGTSFSVVGGTVTETLFAKRPDADQREPLGITMQLDFTAHEALGEVFRESMDFGLAERLVLPPEVVKFLERTGPSWFAERVENAQLEILPDSDTSFDRPTIVRVAREHERPRSLNGNTIWRTHGKRGGTVRVQLEAGVSMTWQLGFKDTDGAAVAIDFEPAGHDATAVARAIRFLDAFDQSGVIELSIDDNTISATLNQSSERRIPPVVQELAEDLAFIERELDVRFRFPKEVVAGPDRLWARSVRMILEGKVALMPRVNGINYTLTGVVNDGLERLLEHGGAIHGRQSEWSITLYGEELFVDDVAFYHPGVEAENGDEILAALHGGTATDRRMSLKALDPIVGFRMYSPSRMQPDDNVVPQPWGLTGIREHPEFRVETLAQP